MTYFLERIAALLNDEYQGRLDKQCLVFPNRRAGLYTLKYLSLKTGKPVWSPSVKTINELFQSCTSLRLVEDEQLIFKLYMVYRNLNHEAESFDDFYFWGDMILNDFDEIDKYHADASKLFANLSELKSIDSIFGDLTQEQIRIIQQFWVNFNAGSPTKQKSDFLGVWTLLSKIYSGFTARLKDEGLAYEGMIFRDVAEKCIGGHLNAFKWDCFHFIGFNALNSCERILMKTLKKAGIARFYWDYDNSFIEENSDHSAGFFIRQNLKEFGNDMPSDWQYDTFISATPGGAIRRVIDTSSDVAQVKLISRLLPDISETGGSEAHHTAIVMTDENLLIPVLTSLPETLDNINITMGYPLKFSPVYSLVKQLLTLQQNSRVQGTEVLFDHKDVFNVLKHSYFTDETNTNGESLITDLINEQKQWIPAGRFKNINPFNEVFRKADSPFSLSEYIKKILEYLYVVNDDKAKEEKYSGTEINIRNEFIYRTLLVFNRIDSLVSDNEVVVSTATFTRLIDKILRGISIPFSGEPLSGIQIMGVLETRALDFKNLIILSVNEGILPKSTAGSSFIPYNLREAFELPTLKHQDSIYAYYFYRLLERAENVNFIYNSNSEGLRNGEMSRFLLQLKYLYEVPPIFSSLGYEITIRRHIETVLTRNSDHIEKLNKIYLGSDPRMLSPSALNTWLYCRMKFYYRYICGLKEPEKIITEIDPALFGNLLHGIMERIYSPIKGKSLDGSLIGAIKKDNERINRFIREIIAEKYHNDKYSELTGSDLIIRDILAAYVQMILKHDASLAPLTIYDLEKPIFSDLEIAYNNQEAHIKAGGIIDRIDYLGGIQRIIDYKTGFVSMEIDSVESLFDENDYKRNEAWFQILMYCELFLRNNPEIKVRPSLYPVRKLSDPGFTDHLVIKKGRDSKVTVEDYSEIRKEYVSFLKSSLETLFSWDEPFIMTEHRRKCETCAYRQLCQR